MKSLEQLQADIAARAQQIRDAHPDWPCARGCDSCCRRLADIPHLSAPEWALLRAGLAALPAERRAEIRARMAEIGSHAPGHIECPLLDRASGACPIYPQRPLACRTYGFYVRRGAGLYCDTLSARVEAGQLNDVVWGNQEAVETQLAQAGDHRSLIAWFMDWEREA